MYYIKQVEGKLADAAKAIRAAVKAGDFDRAREIWLNVTGEDDKDELWFRYNAAHSID